jgi:hypothetical protein
MAAEAEVLTVAEAAGSMVAVVEADFTAAEAVDSMGVEGAIAGAADFTGEAAIAVVAEAAVFAVALGDIMVADETLRRAAGITGLMLRAGAVGVMDPMHLAIPDARDLAAMDERVDQQLVRGSARAASGIMDSAMLRGVALRMRVRR